MAGWGQPHGPPRVSTGDRTVYRNNKPCGDALILTRVGPPSVLLVQRALPPHVGLWATPGGHCNYGEHPQDTAARELEEETGLVLRSRWRLHLYGVFMEEVAEGDCRQVTVYSALVPSHPSAVELRCSDESQQVRFWPCLELPPLAPLTAEILRRWRTAV